MIIAYLFPSDAPDPRDGIGFITVAPNRERAIENLKEQFAANYEESSIEWHVDDPETLPHVMAKWKSGDDGTECTDFYWLHFAEEQ